MLESPALPRSPATPVVPAELDFPALPELPVPELDVEPACEAFPAWFEPALPLPPKKSVSDPPQALSASTVRLGSQRQIRRAMPEPSTNELRAWRRRRAK